MDNDRGCRDLSAGAEKVRVPCVLPPGGSVDQAPSLIYITRSVASSSCTSDMGLDLTATITPVQCTVLPPSGVVGGGTNGSARLFSIPDSREPMDGGSGREMTHASSPQRISAISSVAPPFKGLRQNLKVVGTENGRGFGLYNAGELIKKGEYIGEVRTSILYRFTWNCWTVLCHLTFSYLRVSSCYTYTYLPLSNCRRTTDSLIPHFSSFLSYLFIHCGCRVVCWRAGFSILR